MVHGGSERVRGNPYSSVHASICRAPADRFSEILSPQGLRGEQPPRLDLAAFRKGCYKRDLREMDARRLIAAGLPSPLALARCVGLLVALVTFANCPACLGQG